MRQRNIIFGGAFHFFRCHHLQASPTLQHVVFCGMPPLRSQAFGTNSRAFLWRIVAYLLYAFTYTAPHSSILNRSWSSHFFNLPEFFWPSWNPFEPFACSQHFSSVRKHQAMIRASSYDDCPGITWKCCEWWRASFLLCAIAQLSIVIVTPTWSSWRLAMENGRMLVVFKLVRAKNKRHSTHLETFRNRTNENSKV